MSVLIADYTVVVRKRALEDKIPGGVEAYVRGLRALEVEPQFVCTSDPYLVNASFKMLGGASQACHWSKYVGLDADQDSCIPDYGMIAQPPMGVTHSRWLEVREESGVLTHAWLKGAEPGELAAPAGWVPRPHSMLEHSRLLRSDPVARARSKAIDVVLDTLRQNECGFVEADWFVVLFDGETNRACYHFVIEARDDGQMVCACALNRRYRRSSNPEIEYVWAAAEHHSARRTAPNAVVVRPHDRVQQAWCATFEQRGLTSARLAGVFDELLRVADSHYDAKYLTRSDG